MHLLFWLSMLFILLLVAGALYQSLGAMRDRRRYLSRGRMVDIGEGRELYIHQAGDTGPAVVFESGLGSTSQNWFGMQQAVSGFARTVAYDRLGLGWSSDCATERTPSNIARELRLMLRTAGIAPPYILVGHSFGGLVVRRYAIDFPEDVSGVVLVDAMRPEEWPPLKPEKQVLVDRGIRQIALGRILARFGVARLVATSLLRHSNRTSSVVSRVAGKVRFPLVDRITTELGKMPRTVWPVVAAHWSSPRFYRDMSAYLQAVPATVREMQDATPIEGVPVVLFTPVSAEALGAEALHRIGPATQQVIAQKSRHWVHLDEPEIVIDAIRGMAEQTLPLHQP